MICIQKKLAKYIIYGIILLLIFLSYLLIKPFLSLIITSCLLAYLFFPFYKFLKKITKKEGISALISSLLVVIILTIPFIAMIVGLQHEAFNFYSTYSDNIANSFDCSKESSICSLFESISINEYINIENTFGELTKNVINRTKDFLLSIPTLALHFFIIIFIMYYLFREGEEISKLIINAIKINKERKNKLVKKIRDVVDSIVFGNIVTALVQGFAGAIGFWILGINSPILWGLVMAFFSLIPFVGTAIVWIPASIILVVESMDTRGLIKAIILVLYGFIIIGGIDNILKPKLIGDKAKIHPAIVLLGVLGGLAVFGIIGIILGPLVLGISLIILRENIEDKKEE